MGGLSLRSAALTSHDEDSVPASRSFSGLNLSHHSSSERFWECGLYRSLIAAMSNGCFTTLSFFLKQENFRLDKAFMPE